MVIAHARNDVLELLDLAHDVAPQLGVLFHDRIFIFGEDARFLEN